MDHTTKTHASQVEDKYSESVALALRPLKGRPEVEWARNLSTPAGLQR